ncbi:hypothetical protein JK205_15980 [Gluconobacter cerinus]|uniref:hypothetical protein n=1 Tax=Gluconobacter cerinus TaxID=38307 RepID=UPI001B8CB2DB|nr:hypothetical protein [Gluconobacter cerinus]MBS1020408.1 hypothetical protein [Gluconobacter cerinus]
MSDPDMKKWIKIIEAYNQAEYGTKGWDVTIVGPDQNGNYGIAFVPPSPLPPPPTSP